ncbi:hypothetical protein [Indiicoccus explosivorum]|uniref:hypothetical protein n=1 Tax=Indiicoccus explosivorum TaxID=1917864 RepID=UPI000B450CAE|nr:hypothetical protein [Indiicoccus explosivorum]
MKKKASVVIGAMVLISVIVFLSIRLYDMHTDKQLYQRAVIYGYEDTLRDYEVLLQVQRDIISEEDEEIQERLIDLYRKLSFEMNPQHNTGELLKLFYAQNNPDSAVADYDIRDILVPFSHTLEGEGEEDWVRAANDFEEAIEQMREELEVIKAELDLPPDEA